MPDRRPGVSRGAPLCRYFAQGRCRSGASCPFRHDKTADPCLEVCRFYLRGECAHGNKCRYRHTKPAAAAAAPPARRAPVRLVPAAPLGVADLAEALPPVPAGGAGEGASATADDDRPLCSLYAKTGACERGEACPFVHGDTCPRCGLPCLHPSPARAAEREQHEAECAARHERAKAIRDSRDVECSICLEKVLSDHSGGLDTSDGGTQPDPSYTAKKFGLMEACDHPFCLSCIRQWRGGDADKGQARTCPLCRTRSNYIVPSAVWPRDADEKAALIAEWRGRLASIDCMHWRMGEGTCPFGGSCFYRHAYPDGSLQDRSKSVRFVTVGDDDGTGHIVAAPRLCDFLGLP